MATASMRAMPGFRNARHSHVPDTPASRRTATGPTPGRTPAAQLPDYEPPTFSLGVSHQRAIAALIERNQSIKKLESHLDEAQSALTISAGNINDRLIDARKAAPKRKRRDDEDDGDVDEEVKRGLEELQDKVTRMTTRMEESMRKMIDGKRGLEDIKESLQATVHDVQVNASTQASTQHVRSQRRTRRSSASGSDDEEDEDEDEVQPFTPTDPSGGTQLQAAPIEVFRKKLDDSKTRYQSRSLYDRYADDNDYSNFKRMVHQAQHPDDDVPESDNRSWFQDYEPPPPGVTRARTRAGAADDDESDDDIAIQRATISIKCPLTLQEFKDPMTSKKCAHSFEASAIMEMLNRQHGVPIQCPCGGCRESLTKADLQRDPVLVRKIERLKRAKQLEQEDAEAGGDGNARTQNNATLIDDDGDDVDTVIERQTQRQMKTEPKATGASRGTAAPAASQVVDMLGSSEDEDEEGEEEDEDDTME